MAKCHKIKVPERVCYIEFKKEKIAHSKDIGYTNRKEMVIIDYSKKDEIIGIELVGDKKPCQKTSSARNVRKLIKGHRKLLSAIGNL